MGGWDKEAEKKTWRREEGEGKGVEEGKINRLRLSYQAIWNRRLEIGERERERERERETKKGGGVETAVGVEADLAATWCQA